MHVSALSSRSSSAVLTWNLFIAIVTYYYSCTIGVVNLLDAYAKVPQKGLDTIAGAAFFLDAIIETKLSVPEASVLVKKWVNSGKRALLWSLFAMAVVLLADYIAAVPMDFVFFATGNEALHRLNYNLRLAKVLKSLRWALSEGSYSEMGDESLDTYSMRHIVLPMCKKVFLFAIFHIACSMIHLALQVHVAIPERNAADRDLYAVTNPGEDFEASEQSDIDLLIDSVYYTMYSITGVGMISFILQLRTQAGEMT